MLKTYKPSTFAIISLFIIFLTNPSSGFSQVITGTFAIKNVQTDMVLRIEEANRNNGTALVAYTPVNWKCVTWEFKHLEKNTYQLKNLFTSKTFQPVEILDHIYLEQQPLLPANKNQQYEFILVEENKYLIKSKETDLYLTASDKSKAVNARIILAKKTGGQEQLWMIYEQSPQM
ncbi:MAG: RICIN domain-containing protein [Chitinophagaceae bacterium]